MSIQPGASLLHYRIVDKIGEGGMGEVWRARDTTLDRDVAIKILPAAFAGDADRLGRFEREAKLLASLNHPHIAGIYGLHADQGVRFLAMELVPGEDLAARLAGGPIPLEDAILYSRRIAEALEYAHERGIIHRDLKPANIKVAPDGDVKVLDFGLAKAMERERDGSDPSFTAPPTMTSPAMTQAGIILGTAAYMSPEQARGRPVDKRADNWAFGCVLFEMLTSSGPFGGETMTDVIAAVVTREPDWSRLPASTPASVRQLLKRCLDKDPRTRLRDIGEARIVLADPDGTAPEVEAASGPTAPKTSMVWRWIGVAAAALVAGLVIGRFALVPAPPPVQVFEFDINVPDHPVETGSIALSPDGSRLALVIRNEVGDRLLAVRDMSRTEVRLLPGTTGALYPFWSPDGREIGYFSGDQLSRIAIDAAGPRPVATVSNPRGGAWAAEDIILVGRDQGPIQKVSASGGTAPVDATTIEAGVEQSHAWPAMLPDGRRFVFLADSPTTEAHRLCLGSLDDGATTILRSGVRSQPVLDPSGRLLIGERGQLVAYPFDVDTGALGDRPTLVSANMNPIGDLHLLPVSVSRGGMLALQSTSAESSLVWLDRAGRVIRTIGRPDQFGNVRISPDQKRVAFELYTNSTERQVWVEDLERGVRSPISERGKLADNSAWGPDSQTVYFDSDASGKWEAYRASVTGGGRIENLGLPDGTIEVLILDVSRDGRWLLGAGLKNASRNNLYLFDLQAAAGGWTTWLETPAQEQEGAFSPDSRWLAYTSDASGRFEVYVAPLEGGPAVRRWQISSAGGFEPRFSPDGKVLYYRSPAWEWTAVDLKITGSTVEAGPPKALFQMPVVELPFVRNIMDVLPDGSGFVGLRPVSAGTSSIRIRTRQ